MLLKLHILIFLHFSFFLSFFLETVQAPVSSTTQAQVSTPTVTIAHPKLKFDFRIETINATFYSGDSDLVSLLLLNVYLIIQI